MQGGDYADFKWGNHGPNVFAFEHNETPNEPEGCHSGWHGYGYVLPHWVRGGWGWGWVGG